MKIDVHHHFMSDSYVAAIGLDRIAAQSAAGTVPSWTAQKSIEFMDRTGIAVSVLSVSSPGIPQDTDDKLSALARQCNLEIAQIVSDHPKRFGGFGVIPLPLIDKCLEEISFVLDVLKFEGVGVLSNYNGIHIGDPSFWPILAELDRRHAVVHVHPTSPLNFRGVPGISVSTLEFPFETTRAIASLLVHGTAAKFPNIKYIWSHAGGTMPFLAGRTAALSGRHPNFVQKGKDGFLPPLRKFYYDVTQSTTQGTLDALLDITGPDHLLFGSDFPFARAEMTEDAIENLDRSRLDIKAKAAIYRDAALALMPGLRNKLEAVDS